MSRKQAELLLAAVILTRSTAYLFSKAALESMGTFNVLAVRFLLGFLLLGAIFRKRLIHIKKRDAIGGAVIGAIFTAVMALELTSLKTTETSTVSFLENTAIVFVPLFEAALALCGVGLLTLSSGAFRFTPGEVCCIGAALLYAAAIITTDRFSHRGDALMIGIVQVGTIGVLSLILSLAIEQPHLPSGMPAWGAVLVLAIVCTGFGFTLQPVRQASARGLCALSTRLSHRCSALYFSANPSPLRVLRARC